MVTQHIRKAFNLVLPSFSFDNARVPLFRDSSSPLSSSKQHYIAFVIYSIFARQQLQVGQWFELQDVRNPCLIRVVQVVANRGGLLTVSHGQRHENVFFTNERCHELGWAQRDLQKYTYEGDSLNLLNSARKNAVSSHVFTYSTLREHKFEVSWVTYFLVDVLNELHFTSYSSVAYSEGLWQSIRTKRSVKCWRRGFSSWFSNSLYLPHDENIIQCASVKEQYLHGETTRAIMRCDLYERGF